MRLFHKLRALLGLGSINAAPVVREIPMEKMKAIKKLNESAKVSPRRRRSVFGFFTRDYIANPATRCELYGRGKGRNRRIHRVKYKTP